MHYVGIDVHQRMSNICFLDAHGKKERELVVRGHCGKVVGALKEVPRPFALCFEASTADGLQGRRPQ